MIRKDRIKIDELKSYLSQLPTLSDKERPNRIAKAKEDFRFAVQTYFPHYVSKEESSKFRNFVYNNIDEILKNNKTVFESYRGAAKTTLISRLLPLWLTAIRQTKRYSLIISSTIDVAKETLEFIKTELEENERLRADFDIVIGGIWSGEDIVFSAAGQKIRFRAFGAGKRIRGANWLGRRPDLIICDDIENDENVESKTQREKLYNWFIKAILKLPGLHIKDYNLLFVGTKLHHDSLLSRIEERSDFAVYKFPLVVKFPDNLESIDKRDIKEKDVEGMVVDDESLDKVEILKSYFEDREAFMSEFQNEPLSRDGLVFGGYQTVESVPECDSYTIGIDPALGKNTGDYFAISVLGYLQEQKKYFASTYMYKIKAAMMIEKIIDIYLSYKDKPVKIAIETVQFQEFFKDVLKEKSEALHIHLPIVEVKNTVNKELRIESLSPLINNGTILIDSRSLTLIDELDTYPKSKHDDGLDSLEMAFRIAKTGSFSYKEAVRRMNAKNERLKWLRNIKKGLGI